jgi:hypothetical protein
MPLFFLLVAAGITAAPDMTLVLLADAQEP